MDDQDSRTSSEVQYLSHDHIIIVSPQKVPNAQFIIDTLHHCHPIASLPDQPSEPCLRCGALLTHLSAPVRCRRIKPEAYCSQRCHPPAKAWWYHLVTLIPPCLGKDLTRAFSLSLSSLTLELFEAIAF